ncbi:MAG: multidrug efflux MFS transporter [Elusimicrobia bacterium]|nr:multidrug efflux MFS transporter [Elusimicrobiota bacterium]
MSDSTKLDAELVKISLIMLLGMIAPALDATVVNVAIKTIITKLGSNISTAQWITTAYIFVMGMAVPFSGWLVNRFSGKKLYLIALAVFGVASAGAALSWNIGSLIAFRIIQGAGAGIMLPVMQTVLVRYAGEKKLPSLMSIIGIPAAIVPVLGPTIGGLIVSYFPWQWIFIVNIPVCILAFILAVAKLPPTDAVNKEQPLDIAGLLLLSSAFCALIFGITKLRSDAVLNTAIMLLAAGIALLIFYCFHALKEKKEPPLNVRLFKNRNFSLSIAMVFLYGIIATGTLFILPLYFQKVYQTTAFAAGLLLAPQGIGMLCTRSVSAKCTEQYGVRPVLYAGTICTVIGTVPLALLHTASLVPLIVSLFIRGAGLGVLMVPAMVSVYEGMDDKAVAQGTTATRIFQQIGGAFGTAALAILLQHWLAGAKAGEITSAFDNVFWFSAALAAVLIIPAMLRQKKQLENKPEI